MSDLKPIVKLLKANTGSRRLYDVFTDFVEVMALCMRQASSKLDPVDIGGWQEREDRYLTIVGRYDRVQLDRFGEAMALVTLAIEAEPRDVLGHLYMSLELGAKEMGQFFTPYSIAQVMALFNVDELVQKANTQGFVTVYEPACGAAAFMVATSEALRERGVNPQQQLHVTAEDLSEVSVHMAYVHLSLLGIPAVVHRMNSLTQERWDTWRTPMHVLGLWDYRLKHRDATNEASELLAADAAPAADFIAPSWDDVFAEVLA